MKYFHDKIASMDSTFSNLLSHQIVDWLPFVTEGKVKVTGLPKRQTHICGSADA